MIESSFSVEFAFAAYGVSLLLLCGIFFVTLKRSEYGVLVVISEILILTGAIIYPILFYLGLVRPGIEGEGAIFKLGPPGLLVAVHILLYVIGGACGYALAQRVWVGAVVGKLQVWATAVAPSMRTWKALVLSAVVIWVIFFALVGVDVALTNAALARSGIIDGFQENARWLFLKTLGNAFLFIATSIVPFALERRDENRGFLLIYLVLVVLTFANSISRDLILTSLIAPLLVFAWSRSSPVAVLKTVLLGLCVGIPILLYGKSIGHFIRYAISDGEITTLVAYQGDGSLIEAYMRNVEFIWFSTQAGVDYSLNVGAPLILFEPLVAFLFGVVPSRVLEELGVGYLYYGNLGERLSCINTMQMGGDDCRIPPHSLGYSAYILPLGGGAVIGLLRYGFYGVMLKLWEGLKARNRTAVWLLYFIHLVMTVLMSFIPNRIALAMAAVWIVGGLGLLRAFRRRISLVQVNG